MPIATPNPKLSFSFLTVEEVASHFGCSRNSIYLMVKGGELPPGVYSFGKRFKWPSHEIEKISRFIVSERPREELPDLVSSIVEERKNILESKPISPEVC